MKKAKDFQVYFMAVLAAAATVLFAPAAGATSPSQVGFSLEGCRNEGTIVLPDATGRFVCPDAAYTSGNLGKGWNELDLVPHRITSSAGSQATATTDYTILVVADHQTGGKTGYDFISEPTVDAAASDASCAVSAGPLLTAGSAADPFGGGTDTVMYRQFSIHQSRGSSCRIDYFQRLARGANGYPGSSLQSYLFEDAAFRTGKKTISIPVSQIMAQSLAPDVTSTRGTNHLWTLTKGETPAVVSFPDTCDATNPAEQTVQITISWEKLPAEPFGPATITAHVYATNPAAREVAAVVSSRLQAGSETLDVSPATAVVIPPNTTNRLVLDHTYTWSGPTSAAVTATATAAWIDAAVEPSFGQAGTATATATGSTQLLGTEQNATAVVTATESIDGKGLSFSVDSFSGTAGSFAGYVPGTRTSGPVTWISAVQGEAGSVTFNKTIAASRPSRGSGRFAENASLAGSSGFRTSASTSISVVTEARPSAEITKLAPNVLQSGETAAFTFLDCLLDAPGGSCIASSQKSVQIPFGAGETEKRVTLPKLDPGWHRVAETALPAGYVAETPPQEIDLSAACTGKTSFRNGIIPARVSFRNVTIPSGAEAGWSAALDGPGAHETVTTGGGSPVPFAAVLQEGTYTVTETLKEGWVRTGASGCVFTVDYPRDAGKQFECVMTNTQGGRIVVLKKTNPTGSTQQFTFVPSYDGGTPFSLADGKSIRSGYLTAGTYTVRENPAPDWKLTQAICDNGNDPAAIRVVPGKTVTCTFVNTKKGKLKIVKTVGRRKPCCTERFTFQLRENAAAKSSGTVVETAVADASNAGAVAFSHPLNPGGKYALCEVMAEGWSTSLAPAYAPGGEKRVVCSDFVVGPGEQRTIAVDNTPPKCCSVSKGTSQCR